MRAQLTPFQNVNGTVFSFVVFLQTGITYGEIGRYFLAGRVSHEATRSRLDVSIEPAFSFRETEDGRRRFAARGGGAASRPAATGDELHARTHALVRGDWFCFLRNSGITDASSRHYKRYESRARVVVVTERRRA